LAFYSYGSLLERWHWGRFLDRMVFDTKRVVAWFQVFDQSNSFLQTPSYFIILLHAPFSIRYRPTIRCVLSIAFL